MLLGLEQRRNELSDLRDLDSVTHGAKRLSARNTCLHVAERAPQLVGERTLACARDTSQGRIEAESRLDTDRQLIDGVRRLASDGLLALVTHTHHPVVG